MRHISNYAQMGKEDSKRKKELAKLLFMNGEPMNGIADKVGISRVTVTKWAAEGEWKSRRAAQSVTRPELVNKLLKTIDDLLESVAGSNDPALLSGLGDKLAKLSAVIEKLDKKANVVDTIEVFMAFSKWMEYRMNNDPELTPELVKKFHYYQDLFINESLKIA